MRSYKAKMVEPIELPSREEREAAIEQAGYNVFNLDARDVYIDLLTDSGTGTMSADQWAAMIRGDEAYAGSESFDNLAESVRDVMGFEHVVPTHQGRGAENVLYGVLLEDGDVVPNNSHFDTTRAHIVNQGAEPVDCPSPASRDPNSTDLFKGNFDLDAGHALVEEVGADSIPVVVLTITNNSVAGQPVSMENIRATAEFASDIDAMFVMDACRFAENAHFIQTNEAGYEDMSIAEIAREQFEHADAITMSGKKDALVNIGGFAAMNDETIFEHAKQRAILYEGFPTYGGLSGRDIEAMAVGLREAVTPPYIGERVEQVAELGDLLSEEDVPVYLPTGGHAVYLDASEIFSHIPKEQFPGQALVCALYREGGVRGVELGGFAFPGTDRPDLVRLALPRRTYSFEHLEHIAETAVKAMENAEEYEGLEIIEEPPMKELRHFSARLEPTSN
ncbi:tryptophanase [Haloferax mediterranei ATCC 33500]|uniref:Tryptophanase n=1 Tax=Haloferax mediterranei (strain ATCC 33500 / DSM 1411 / JCM 8866 / NBRC 14739 / NCIMB 2177 / R-4) TaxID=523841 RepID=I3R0J3_HALMT|nr:tryptophanase [Haloferax mediterranei]AFK17753.2 tryptophanase [Haloferax mediterranei ATCC 33500]AHZ22815.1 tryptophanase [Haloferax mediterranei ATCC 33500]EMA02975.1 tryptophanase/L-cysteine desulfhydrase, PLP-dependent [Haloferax mediterranei ATCC 33500]MDX5987842.1 tryptophanase [Haloferax mediterranei ATCC 33500]QCQ74318.1 tryptophanase [Haloferax mediterranei ATCC 33500]